MGLHTPLICHFHMGTHKLTVQFIDMRDKDAYVRTKYFRNPDS